MTIIKGHPKYADIAAELIWMSGKEEIPMTFGKNWRRLLTKAYRRKSGDYTYKNSILSLADDGKVTGISTFYDHSNFKKTSLANILMILGGGWAAIKKIGVLDEVLKGLMDIAEDGSYVLHLAVLPEYRSQGIGSALLDETAKILKERGIKSMSLDVSQDNTRAQQMYIRYGFFIEAKYSFVMAGEEHFLARMTKKLFAG